ncbi:MAG TPA: flagellar biosynthetic protein FliR [Phycisphaerae bacterium]|nr:flagellar biosynthetic protein FliR [Phycisphaerae bacterium]
MPVELLSFQMLLPAFVLVLARVSGLVIAVPILSSLQIPRDIKVWLVVTLSLMVFPLAAVHLPTSLTLGQAAAGAVSELIIGEILGLGTGLIFFAAEFAGKFVSHQAGLSLGTVFNPFFDEESTVIDQLWFFTAAIIFMACRGHIALVTVLLDSIRNVPPLMANFDGTTGDFAIAIMHTTFSLGIQLAAPTILALLVASLVMGFLTRTMPQINILSVGFSLKVAIALLILALSIPASEELLGNAIWNGLDHVGVLFEQMGDALKNG